MPDTSGCRKGSLSNSGLSGIDLLEDPAAVELLAEQVPDGPRTVAASARAQRVVAHVERRLAELDRVEAERRVDVPRRRLGDGDGDRLDAVARGRRHHDGARDGRLTGTAAAGSRAPRRACRACPVEASRRAAASRRRASGCPRTARWPTRVIHRGSMSMRTGTTCDASGRRDRRVDADVAVALVPDGVAKPVERRVERDEVERLARRARATARAQLLVASSTGARCVDVERPDARRLAFDDAERDGHPRSRRREHRVHLRFAKAASPVVDAQLGDVLAECRRRGAPAVDEELTPRQLAERRDEHEPAARRAREDDQLQIVRRHLVRARRTAATRRRSSRVGRRWAAQRSVLPSARATTIGIATQRRRQQVMKAERKRSHGWESGTVLTGPVRKAGRAAREHGWTQLDQRSRTDCSRSGRTSSVVLSRTEPLPTASRYRYRSR